VAGARHVGGGRAADDRAPGLEDGRFAELTLALPRDRPLEQDAFDDYKLRRGSEALATLLDGAVVSELGDPGRTSVIPRTRRFGRR
jgi:hypothetical protein